MSSFHLILICFVVFLLSLSLSLCLTFEHPAARIHATASTVTREFSAKQIGMNAGRGPAKTAALA